MRPPFISGWLAFTLSILIVFGLPAFIWHTTGHNALPASNWWWWVGMLALAVGARAVQYFKQQR